MVIFDRSSHKCGAITVGVKGCCYGALETECVKLHGSSSLRVYNMGIEFLDSGSFM